MHDKFLNSSRTASEPVHGPSVTSRLRDAQLERHRITFDASLIKNRVNQLKSIEAKMLKKIDKTRIEAEKVRKVKEQNFVRHEERIKAMQDAIAE